MHRIEKIKDELDPTGYGLHVNGSRVGFYASPKNLILDAMREQKVNEFVFSEEEIPGGHVLYCEGVIDNGTYFDSSGKTIYFCKDKIVSLFGKVPNKIWWRPVK